MEKEGSLSLQSISLTMGDLTNQFLKRKNWDHVQFLYGD